jgi:DNA polymerase III alpha subunit
MGNRIGLGDLGEKEPKSMTTFNIELRDRRTDRDSANLPNLPSRESGKLLKARWDREVEAFEQRGLIGPLIELQKLADGLRDAGHRLQVVGSAASSMMFHAMGLSPICPVEHGLYLERFLDPGDGGLIGEVNVGGLVSACGLELLRVLSKRDFAVRVFEHDVEVNGRKEQVVTIGARQPGEKDDGARLILQIAAPSVLALTSHASCHEHWMRDQPTWDLLASGDTEGIPNLESAALRSVLRRLKPSSLTELASAMVSDRPDQIDCDEPGHPVFQEDLMTMLHQDADFPLREAYELVRTLAKNRPQATEAAKERFRGRSQRRGLDPERSDQIWEHMRAKSQRALCKAHVYVTALHSLQAAFVKAHEPDQFRAMIAAMTN